MRILITGATGYVGGRLLRVFEQQPAPPALRCLVRRPEYFEQRVGPGTEIVQGDLLDPASLTAALAGVEVAYYLVHAMGSSGDFEIEEQRGARNFAVAARQAGVKRIVYLGGLGEGEQLSPHLRSRQAVGAILRDSGVPTIEFRASVIIGSGSLSFELFRALVEKLPVMVAPRWVRIKAQPIAIEDVLAYLVAAATVEIEESVVVEIGGTDQVSYQEMMREYAAQRRLGRWIIPVPLLTPRLSSLWLGLVTPVYSRVGRKLIDSLRHKTVVTSDTARQLFPEIQPRGMGEAIERALRNEDQQFAATRWNDALSARGQIQSYGGVKFGARLVDSRSVRVRATTDEAFRPIRQIGGKTGWYYGNLLWRTRGFLDILAGGAGLRRGRRDPAWVLPGETIDFWRVEGFEPNRLLRLSAEMKLPGRAWLQFEVEPVEGGSRIRQTAIFDPVGLFGLLYWYALYPLHQFVFRGMLHGIARAVPLDS
jgi:uncharacterized protein YbjT (DUF2867 family)